MLSQEITQHLTADQESDMMNNSSALDPLSYPISGYSPRGSQTQSRSGAGVDQVRGRHGAATRYEEQEEMRRNLDPLIFADREFCSAVNTYGSDPAIDCQEPYEKDQLSNATSFIEMTTQINAFQQHKSPNPHQRKSIEFDRKNQPIGNQKRIIKPLKAQREAGHDGGISVGRSVEIQNESHRASIMNEAASHGGLREIHAQKNVMAKRQARQQLNYPANKAILRGDGYTKTKILNHSVNQTQGARMSRTLREGQNLRLSPCIQEVQAQHIDLNQGNAHGGWGMHTQNRKPFPLKDDKKYAQTGNEFGRQRKRFPNKDEYRILHREESTDIRLPDADTFNSGHNGMYNQRKQFQIKFNSGRKNVNFKGHYNRRGLVLHENIASLALRQSKETERRSNLTKAYHVEPRSQPHRLAKQSSANFVRNNQIVFFQPNNNIDRVNSPQNQTMEEDNTFRHSNGQFSNETFDEINKGKAEDGQGIFAQQNRTSTFGMIKGNTYRSALHEALRAKKKSQLVGNAAKLRLHEHRIETLRAMINNQSADEKRPKSSSIVGKNAGRTRSGFNSYMNRDLQIMQGKTSNGFYATSRRILRKNDSSSVGSAKNMAVRIPSNMNISHTKYEEEKSQLHSQTSFDQPREAGNIQSLVTTDSVPVKAVSRQNKGKSGENLNHKTDDRDSCLEIINEQRKNLNQVSASTFVLSEPKNVTVPKASDGQSPMSSPSVVNTKFFSGDSAVAKSNKNIENINSLNEQRIQTQLNGATGLISSKNNSAVSQPRLPTQPDSQGTEKQSANLPVSRQKAAGSRQSQRAQKHRLILFANGDQIKLDLMDNQNKVKNDDLQQNVKRRISS